MTSARSASPKRGSRGGAPSRVQGQSPWWGVRRALIVADVVASKQCAVSLAFDILKRKRYDIAIVIFTRYTLSS